MTRKQKKMLYQILIAAALFLLAKILPVPDIAKFILLAAAYLLVGREVVWEAILNIGHGQIFDEKFLMSLATLGAVALGEYDEAVGVMLFFQIGELFQDYAVNKSRQSITELMSICPETAVILREDGTEEEVMPEEVAVGDILLVKAGEKIPLDGEIVEGASSLDTSPLTGESIPRDVEVGNQVISGCINLNGTLKVRASKEFTESTVAKILDMVENAGSQKGKTEKFITRFARYYTPFVVFAALALAVIPPVFTLIVTQGVGIHDAFADWVYQAMTFLVISCPCALVISIPLSFFGGIGAASKYGILVKGSNYLELLAQTEVVVCDKTGTLTEGKFRVTQVNAEPKFAQSLLEVAAYAECNSNHPIAESICQAYGQEIDRSRLGETEEISGYGMKCVVDGKQVLAGNHRLMEREHIPFKDTTDLGTHIYVAVDGIYAGSIVIADQIKKDAKQAIKSWKELGVQKTVMLTGDTKKIGEAVANELGMDEVYTQLLPGDKVEKVKTLMEQKSEKGNLVFIGDGINDAPVLAMADVGVAMGGLGSDAAIEAADLVIMTDEPSLLSEAIKIARKTVVICHENIVLALGVKFFVLILGLFRMANMWAAVFADVGVAMIAILNAIRTLHIKKK